MKNCRDSKPLSFEDKDIVDRVLKGQKEVFEMIIAKYQNPILNYIGRMVGNRQLALDFTQDVFIKCFTGLHTYQSKYKFSSWLFKIASNTIIDYWRKKKLDMFSINCHDSDERMMPLQIAGNEVPVAQRFELSCLQESIEKILEHIPASLRELFIWRHINGFSYEEIAEIKKLPLGTIKNRIFQAKELIRKQLEKQDWIV